VAGEEKLLLVTFPVDLGNRTNEQRLVAFFSSRLDLKVHRFAAQGMHDLDDRRRTPRRQIRDRILCSRRLRREVAAARRDGRIVLFQNISPAVYAWAVTQRPRHFIIADWTRKLYEPLVGRRLSPPLVTGLHRRVLASTDGVLCVTDAVERSLADDYDVSPSKLIRVELPFDIDTYHPVARSHHDRVRLLFVGGDFERKGGDALLDWFVRRGPPGVDLTVVTNTPVSHRVPGVRFERGVKHGETRHVRLFQTHDLFVLPTAYDSYPVVLGEAASCGMAIAATAGALGAPEVVAEGANGVIRDTADDLFREVDRLVADPAELRRMGLASRRLMEKKFAPERIFEHYRAALFGDSPRSRAGGTLP
jgi:glycosyltransferase involved in cell wall biosynthesis